MDGHRLVPPDKAIRESYERLVAEVEEQIDRKQADCFPATLQCGPGCTKCCIRFSLLPLEAALVRVALTGVEAGQRGADQLCVLLKGGLCIIYADRPLICRTQGLPLGYVDEEKETIEVSACDLNFADHYAFTYDELLLMDRFNAVLAELNGRYCRAAGFDPQQRIDIEDLLEGP